MNYADNFTFYVNGELASVQDEQPQIATEEELKWMDNSISVPFQVHRTDGSWGDEYGIIPSDTKPGRLPPYIIFHRPKGSIGRGDKLLSKETCEVRVRKAVWRYIFKESEETLAVFAYL